MKRSMAVAAFAVLGVLMGGCSSPPEVVPSKGVRPPTSMDQVQIYQKPPQKYEILGTIVEPITQDMRWNGDETPGFKKLLTAASAKGANGILLQADEGEYSGKALARYNGVWYQVPIRRQPADAVVVKAIYKLEETK